LQDLPKFTQICIFGLKTNHLATLVFFPANEEARLETVAGPLKTKFRHFLGSFFGQ
jgi:hypothetical protein